MGRSVHILISAGAMEAMYGFLVRSGVVSPVFGRENGGQDDHSGTAGAGGRRLEEFVLGLLLSTFRQAAPARLVFDLSGAGRKFVGGMLGPRTPGAVVGRRPVVGGRSEGWSNAAIARTLVVSEAAVAKLSAVCWPNWICHRTRTITGGAGGSWRTCATDPAL